MAPPVGKPADDVPADQLPVAPKPAPGPLTQRVKSKPTKEARAVERAKILAEAPPQGAWHVTRGKITYTLTMPQWVLLRDGLVFVPTVTCDPSPPIAIDPDGYLFANPPILVPDGTAREVTVEFVDEKTGEVHVETTKIANFREDPAAAIQEMVSSCVLRDPPVSVKGR